MSNNICLVIAGVDGVLVHPDLSVMAQSFLQPDSTGKVIDAITSHALDCWVYTDHDSLCAIPMARTSRGNSGQWTVKFAPTVVSDFTPHLERVAKDRPVCSRRPARPSSLET